MNGHDAFFTHVNRTTNELRDLDVDGPPPRSTEPVAHEVLEAIAEAKREWRLSHEQRTR